MKEWTTACPDWERRIQAGESLIPLSPLFPEEAEEALAVFKELRAVDVRGSPKMGELCLPWILDFVAVIFGAHVPKGPDAGRRLITEFLLSVSKKNGKSTLAAGIMLTALILNWRKSADFLILAPTIEVANNSFIPARDMVNADEELKALLHVQEHYKTITHRTTGATLKVVAADNEAVSGKKATGVLVDELWLFGKKANAESMLLEATGGQAARPEGFTIYLSTQSDEPPAGVWEKKLKYARGVRDGRIKDANFLPVLYEWPETLLKSNAPMDEQYWGITNPNLGKSVDPNFIRRKLKEAEQGGKESIQAILAKHLNVEIGLALRSDRWVGADFWEQQSTAGLTLQELIRRCEVIVVGLDGGGMDDLFGLAVVGREKVTGNWLCWNHAWAHPIALERRKEISPALMDFRDQGDLTLVERVGQDIEEIGAIVSEVRASGKLEKVAVDSVGLGSTLETLNDLGLDVAKEVIAIQQGYKLMGAIQATERKLAEGAFFHTGAPLMAWTVGNARIETKGNAILITKYASGKGKIDPLMATLNACAVMATNPAPRGAYEIHFI